MLPETLPFGLSRETKIVLDAKGQWWNEGDPIEHPNVTRAFFGWIQRHEDGRFILKNSINWAYIEVLGAPSFVEACRVGGEGVTLFLADGSEERLLPETLVMKDNGALWCKVRGGTLDAEFRAHAMFQLEPVLVATADGIALKIAGKAYIPTRANKA